MNEDTNFLTRKRDHEPLSSPGMLRNFMDSVLYKDFKTELAIRIEDLRDFLEVSKGKHYIEAQGAVAFARTVEDIFQDLLSNKLDDLEREDSMEEIEDE